MSDFDIDFDAVETFTSLFADPGSPLDWRILGANFGGQKLRGTFDQHKRTLRNANQAGNEIFLMVNETDGTDRQKQRNHRESCVCRPRRRAAGKYPTNRAKAASGD